MATHNYFNLHMGIIFKGNTLKDYKFENEKKKEKFGGSSRPVASSSSLLEARGSRLH